MDNERCFLVIHTTEDNSYVDKYTEKQLEAELNDWVKNYCNPPNFVTHVPDLEGCNEVYIVEILGEPVVPKAKETITKYIF